MINSTQPLDDHYPIVVVGGGSVGLSLAAGAQRWTAMEGGFPIIVEGECLGGIGVSGGDWQQDADIAAAALAAVGIES